MSFNRLRYDTCAYRHNVAESVGTLSWILDPNRFENVGKCRVEFGVVGGTNVGHVQGNLVDLESDLKGTTRLNTKCPTLQYINPCPNSSSMNACQPKQIVIRNTPTTRGRVINTNMVNLPSCQMFRYKPIPLPPPMEPVKCRYF